MRKYSFAKFFHSRIPFIIGIILCVFIALNFVKVFSKSYSTRQDIKRLKNEISELERSQQRLGEFYSLLSSDFFTEKEARLKFGLQKQGEYAVVIEENTASVERTKPTENTERNSQKKSKNTLVSNTDTVQFGLQKQNNPQAWWDYFFSVRE